MPSASSVGTGGTSEGTQSVGTGTDFGLVLVIQLDGGEADDNTQGAAPGSHIDLGGTTFAIVADPGSALTTKNHLYVCAAGAGSIADERKAAIEQMFGTPASGIDIFKLVTDLGHLTAELTTITISPAGSPGTTTTIDIGNHSTISEPFTIVV